MADDDDGSASLAGMLGTLNSTQNAGVKYLGQIIAAIKSVFPQQTGTATTATTGPSITLPAHPVGYIVVTLPNGTIAKVPFYNE